jgi:hypothetical protein
LLRNEWIFVAVQQGGIDYVVICSHNGDDWRGEVRLAVNHDRPVRGDAVQVIGALSNLG